MAWWIKIPSGSLAGTRKQETKVMALWALCMAAGTGVDLDQCGLYRRHPEAFPGEPNLLPGIRLKLTLREAKKGRR